MTPATKRRATRGTQAHQTVTAEHPAAAVAWTGRSWRMPAWLWLSLAAMSAATLHILLDFGVGLFPMTGQLSPAVTAMVTLIALIHLWWGVSLVSGSHGNGGGLASAAILGLGWTLLINGAAIQYCPPSCPEAAPLSDIAHLGSILFGITAPAAAIWTLWRHRVRPSPALPIGAVALVVTTIVALANSVPT